ncbi:MAG: SPOR domain-containing protein [Parvibaculum sp.]|uniref:SPOR domain-containing protein n=1 Tax=Parvibaculum sp. TaxID=2024848 RepID=UPI0025D09C43|nr:SPOR domain-containing protein [Parvibaculum sp.]MCE9649326.1 SPOR domain-containing protein [Parvibaculum sp.]
MSDGGRHEPGYGYEPEEDDYYTYDATDDEDEGRRRPIVVLAIVALIVVFAGVVFLAYKQGLKQGAQGNPPIIRADDSPSKVAPVNPGGMEIPHQDRSVYDRLSGAGDNTQPDTEHLLPKAEEPMSMGEPAPATPSAPPPPSAVTEAPPVQPAPVGPVEMTPSTPPTATPSVPAAPEASPPAAATSGGYVAQLAAFRDEASARAELKKLQKKFPALTGLTADIQRADLGEKGIYYRLRAGYLDKTKAQALCADLKTQGQACLVRPK